MVKSKSTLLLTGVLLLLAHNFVDLSVCYGQEISLLIAKGHGVIKFTGEGPIAINGQGSLVVNENCQVMLFKSDGAAVSLDEIEFYTRTNAGVVYVNIDGKVQIDNLIDNGIEVSFSGANIGVRIDGEGTAVLKGYGIYIDNFGKTGRWSAEGTMVRLTR